MVFDSDRLCSFGGNVGFYLANDCDVRDHGLSNLGYYGCYELP